MSDFNPHEATHSPTPPSPGQGDWCLEIFSGLHRAARVRLEQRPWYLIGAAEDCDVVLRDAGVHPHHLLVSQDGAQWVLRALDAPLQVDERDLAAGTSVAVSGTAWCRVADVSFGIGQPGSEAWGLLIERAAKARLETVEAHAAELPPTELVPAQPESSGDEAGLQAPAVKRKRAGPSWRRLGYVGGVGLLIAMTSAFGWVVRSQVQQATEAKTSVERIVATLGLKELKIERDQNDHVHLRGTVATEALRTQLQKSLKEGGLEPTTDVVTGERLAAGVQDSFRQKGLPVEAHYAGGGKVIVAGASASPQAELVIRDLLAKTPSLNTIELSPPSAEQPPAQAGIAPPAPSGAGAVAAAAPDAAAARDPKRVVAVVGGEHAFLLTQDGTRYLTGSIMPNGSLIESVDGFAVTFLRGGNRVQVDF